MLLKFGFASLFCAVALAGPGRTTRILIDLKPTRETAADELVRWEAFKLTFGKPNTNPVIEMPETMAVDGAIRDKIVRLETQRLGVLAQGKDLRPKGPLTLDQIMRAVTVGDPLRTEYLADILSILRIQDAKERLGGTQQERAKALLAEEFRAWGLDPDSPLVLPAALKAALERQVREEMGKRVPPVVPTATEIAAILRSGAAVGALIDRMPTTQFPISDWARFGGDTRISARVNRSNSFLADLRREAGERLNEIGMQRQRDRGVTEPRVTAIQPRPSLRIPKAASPAPRRGATGFDSKPGYGRGAGHRGGVVSLDSEPAATTSLTSSDRAKLNAERDRGHLSLEFVSFYAKSPPAACQLTLIGDEAVGPTHVTETTCSYPALTARHCEEDDHGEVFTHVSIPPFGNVVVTRIGADPSGGDLAMFTFEAECRKDVPMAKLSLMPPREGEPIVVHAAIPLFGQASSNGADDTKMMMNVRDPQNGGIGIEHGNSGGAVTNANGEILGVISSKLADPAFHGIGFFATRESLFFANEFVNPNFNRDYLAHFRQHPGDRQPASHGD